MESDINTQSNDGSRTFTSSSGHFLNHHHLSAKLSLPFTMLTALRYTSRSSPSISRTVAENVKRVMQPRRTFASDVLPSLASTASPDFAEKAAAMDALVVDLEEKLARAREGGGAKAAERMRSRGKMLPRER